jgi:hypothetical protein
MVLDALKDVVGNIKDSAPKVGESLLLFGADALPVAISKDNFRPIGVSSGSDMPVFFIDGGNQEIIGSPQFSVQFIRVYWTKYVSSRRVECGTDEFFVLAQAEAVDGVLSCNIKTFPVRRSMVDESVVGIQQFFSFRDAVDDVKGFNDSRISSLASSFRRKAELSLARSIAMLNPGACVVLDGCLFSTDVSDSKVVADLLAFADSKDVSVVALSKSSGMMTESGCAAGVALGSFVCAELSDDCWFYHPVAVFGSDSLFDVCLVKLHPLSRHVFRIDFSRSRTGDLSMLLGVLVSVSCDSCLLGYPYGLIEADRFARVSDEEANYLKTIVEDILRKSGDKGKVSLASLSASDVHGILDSIR